MKQSIIAKIGVLLGLFFCFTASAANTMLLPPWYVLQNRLKATLSVDPCVQVADLTGEGLDMEIKITVCNEVKAHALAAFVSRIYEYNSNLAVAVKVYSPNFIPVEVSHPSTAAEATELLNQALIGNKYFIKAIFEAGHQSGAAFAIFNPMVVQYYSDDISDLYLNTNEVAAKAFSEVFNFTESTVHLYATTSIQGKRPMAPI